MFFGHFIQKGHRTIPPRREVLHPLDCLFPSFIVALQFFPVVFHIVELFGQFLLSVRVLLNITLQFLNELFLLLNRSRVDHLVTEKFQTGLHHIHLTFQEPDLLTGAFHTGVCGRYLLFIKSTVAFHKIQLLNALQPCKHLAYKRICFRGEVVILLFEPAAHDVCHSHVVMDGLKRQPEPLQNCFTEGSDNLFLVYFFCMADTFSCRPAARRAPPDGIVPISVCHMEKTAALPAD